MPDVAKTVTTTWSDEQNLAHMADFRNTGEWDPGVAAASLVDGDSDSVSQGSAFALAVLVGRQRLSMRYQITDYARGRSPSRVHARSNPSTA